MPLKLFFIIGNLTRTTEHELMYGILTRFIVFMVTNQVALKLQQFSFCMIHTHYECRKTYLHNKVVKKIINDRDVFLVKKLKCKLINCCVLKSVSRKKSLNRTKCE